MDLAITGYVLTFCALLLFRIGHRFGTKHPIVGRFLLIAGMSTAVWMSWTCGSDLRWAQYVPFSSVLMLSNAFVILVVGSAGLIVGCRCLKLRRQQLAVGGLCLTAACFIGASLVRPLWQPLNLEVPATWNDAVCMQSHEASCAPAAAATLLRQYGIHRSETEMALASLTSNQGTLALGTYRGLCLGVRGRGMSPKALVCCPDTYSHTELTQRLPLLAHVNVDTRTWLPGNRISGSAGHAVVVLKQLSNGDWLIADPAVGKVHWRDDFFRGVWIGEGMYLASHHR